MTKEEILEVLKKEYEQGNFTKESYDLLKDLAEKGKVEIQSYKGTTYNNKCKYCGRPNNSTDEDILCNDCRETFGHTFYSEL